MNRNQKIILWGAVGVFAALAALIIVLIVNLNKANNDNATNRFETDSLKALVAEMEAADGRIIESYDLDTWEQMGFTIQNDSILMMYNDMLDKYTATQSEIDALTKQLEQEKKSGKADKEKIKKLEAEITTLKDIAKHYLEEMTRLKAENDQIKAENAQQKQQIEELTQKNASVSETNAKLEKTVEQAKQLSVSSISVSGYNKEDAKKAEKEIKAKKVKVIGVNFTVAQNNTAAAGTRTFYIRIISPEGSVLPGGPSFTVGGETLTASASKDVDYKNEQATYAVYYNVSNTTLIAGDYKAEVYEGGKCLATSSFSVKK